MIFHRKKETLPAVEPASRATTPVPAPSAADAPRKKVLVVDDDPVVVQALSLKLSSEGFAVIAANDGSQALTATRREKPDVMLLDVNFPPDVAHGGGVPWNGFLLTQWLRRLEDVKDTPVILISANDRQDYAKRASDAGATAFLSKPIDSNQLLASIQRALFQAPPPHAPRAVSPGSSAPAPVCAQAGPGTAGAPNSTIDLGL